MLCSSLRKIWRESCALRESCVNGLAVVQFLVEHLGLTAEDVRAKENYALNCTGTWAKKYGGRATWRQSTTACPVLLPPSTAGPKKKLVLLP
mmetsp:Transcript_51248/g.128589  ORF Transcript_51248/g.128589 Transcript_51248/m.128589 type:complete len:92 (+) Transcript_51248:544-819(+)